MARKASDLMSLLAHRGAGRRRKQGGLQKFFASVRAALPSRKRSPRGGTKTRRGQAPAGLAIAAAGFVLLGAGYLLGSFFPVGDAFAGGRGLRADQGGNPAAPRGVAPGPVGEHEDLEPLTSTFLMTAVYFDHAPASEAAGRLIAAGLPTARPHKFWDEGQGRWLFALVVYFDGPNARKAAAQRLRAVDAPDEIFSQYRESYINAGKDWPLERRID